VNAVVCEILMNKLHLFPGLRLVWMLWFVKF